MPCGSSLETNILLALMSSILVTFLFFYESRFFFLSQEFTFFLLILIFGEKKVKVFIIACFKCTEIDHIFYCKLKLIFQHSGL